MNRVYVVGGGPSLTGTDFKSLTNEATIAINKTVLYLSRPSFFITMDYTLIRKISLSQLKDLQCPRFFVANLSVPYLQIRRGAITDTRSSLIYQDIYECFDTLIFSRTENGMGTSFRDFRCGNNSGYCGLQLAVALGYTEIFLLGIDLKADRGYTHFHQGYKEAYSTFTKKLPSYHETFVQGLEDIKKKLPSVAVYSCSPISSLNNIIPYVSLDDSFKESN